MNTTVQIILTALLPVAILSFYIYRKDKNAPEPALQLIKAFCFGLVSVPISLCLSIPFGYIGLYPVEASDVWGSIRTAFFGAAIPEETAKFAMLWLLLRRNRYFDENMDGIVYAVCISLGFAALENLMYLFSNTDSYLTVGVARAVFAVPGHFCYGILMGYYYSLVKFCPHDTDRNMTLVLLVPILAHAVYDSILFIINFTTALTGILMIVFIIFCFKLWKVGSTRIKEHIKRDLL